MCSTSASLIESIDYTTATLDTTLGSGSTMSDEQGHEYCPHLRPVKSLCFNTIEDVQCSPPRGPVPRHEQLPMLVTYPTGIFAVLSVIAAVLTVGCFGPSEEELAREHYEQGLQFEEHGSYRRAREEFTPCDTARPGGSRMRT